MSSFEKTLFFDAVGGVTYQLEVESDDGGFDDRIRSVMRNQHKVADLRQEVVVIDGAREQTLPDIRRDAELWARALVARPPWM